MNSHHERRTLRCPVPPSVRVATHEYLTGCRRVHAGVLGRSAAEVGRSGDEDAQASGAPVHRLQLAGCHQHHRRLPVVTARQRPLDETRRCQSRRQNHDPRRRCLSFCLL